MSLPAEYVSATKFQRLRIVRPDLFSEVIQAFRQPVRLTLENRETSKNYMPICRVLDGTGIVKVKEVHQREGGRAWHQPQRPTEAGLPTAHKDIANSMDIFKLIFRPGLIQKDINPGR